MENKYRSKCKTRQLLYEYHETLKNEEKLVVHSNRGEHYRWPEWINRMEKYYSKNHVQERMLARQFCV